MILLPFPTTYFDALLFFISRERVLFVFGEEKHHALAALKLGYKRYEVALSLVFNRVYFTVAKVNFVRGEIGLYLNFVS